MIDLDPMDEAAAADLKVMLQKHWEFTRSNIAEFILNDFDNQLNNFVMVFPKDYKKALQANRSEQGTPAEEIKN